MYTREAPDCWGLHKNMNCAFAFKENLEFAVEQSWQEKACKTFLCALETLESFFYK